MFWSVVRNPVFYPLHNAYTKGSIIIIYTHTHARTTHARTHAHTGFRENMTIITFSPFFKPQDPPYPACTFFRPQSPPPDPSPHPFFRPRYPYIPPPPPTQSLPGLSSDHKTYTRHSFFRPQSSPPLPFCWHHKTHNGISTLRSPDCQIRDQVQLYLQRETGVRGLASDPGTAQRDYAPFPPPSGRCRTPQWTPPARRQPLWLRHLHPPPAPPFNAFIGELPPIGNRFLGAAVGHHEMCPHRPRPARAQAVLRNTIQTNTTGR